MRRRGLRLAALLLALLPGCAKIAGTNVGEVGEIFTMGSAKRLQKPLRAVRGETRVLIFALDGVGGDDLAAAIRDGRMPNLAGLLGPGGGDGVFQHGYLVPNVLTILPSATIPAWTSVFTGTPPGRSGVPGNEWFAREEMRFYAPVPVTITNRTHAARIYTDDLMSGLVRTPTLYEQLPPQRMHVSAQPIFRGADLVTVPDLAKMGDLFGALIGESVTGSAKQSSRVARETDEGSIGSLLDVVEDLGIPDVQTVYFNGIDLLTHFTENPVEDQQRYLQAVTDTLIGKVLDLYRRQGALDRTHVLVIADHGHTPVLPDDRHSLYTEGDDEPPALIRRAGFRLRPFALTPETDDYQAVVAYQGFAAYLYLADRSSCPAPGQRCDWKRPPRLEEDVMPVVRAFDAANRTGEGAPELRGTLDLILVRVSDSAVRLFDGERLVEIGAYLRSNPRPDLLRLEERIAELMLGPHGRLAGDVVLLARTGGARPIEERFYFGAPQNSEHGGAHSQDSLVPLLVAHPARSGADLQAAVRRVVGASPTQLHFAPLVRSLMARE